MINHQLG